MVIPVKSVVYTHPFFHRPETMKVGCLYIDWQGDGVGTIKYLQIFTGTGVRIEVENTEHWIHWGRIIEWEAA